MKKRKQIVSSLVLASYLANPSINVLAEELKDIDMSNLKNISQNKILADNKAQSKALSKVYLDSTGKNAGTGTEQDPTNSFEEALNLVDDNGIIYISGDITVDKDITTPDNKTIWIYPKDDKSSNAKIEFQKKLTIGGPLYLDAIKVDFTSTDKDCIFVNGNFLSIYDTEIMGKPNIFIGAENGDVSKEAYIRIAHNSTSTNKIGNINLGGKNGSIDKAEVDIESENIEGILNGNNVKVESKLNITSSLNVDKIENINKVFVSEKKNIKVKDKIENVEELHIAAYTEISVNGMVGIGSVTGFTNTIINSEGNINIKNNINLKDGAVVNVGGDIQGDFKLDVVLPSSGKIKEGTYVKSKSVTGNMSLSDNLKNANYRLNRIDRNGLIEFRIFHSSTNSKPTIDGLTDINIKKGNKVDLTKGVTAKDNEDGDLSSKIVFPNNDLSTLNIGQHKITYNVTDSDNNTVTKTRTVNVTANSIAKQELIGTDRYETAVKISREGWKAVNGQTAKTVILVNGDNKHLVDGLTATPLASALDAPILLSRKNNIPQSTVDEIKRLNPSEVIVIGGTTVVEQSVIDQLKTINGNLSVKRISGINRYETSLNVAKELNTIVPIKKIYVGAGLGEADSLSISSVAGREKSPIILTSLGGLDNNTYSYLKSKNLEDAYFIGGTTVISNKVIEQVNGITSKNVLNNRISGLNRNETNANVIKKFYPNSTLNGVVIAKDLNLVDALAVGPLAAKRDMPVVLAESVLSAEQEAVLKAKTSDKIFQAGGGISTSVLENLKNLLSN